VVLEVAARQFADLVNSRSSVVVVGVRDARQALDELQRGEVAGPAVDVFDSVVSAGPSTRVPVRVVRPKGVTELLPAVLYMHGGGWVLGGTESHGRLISELAAGSGAAVVFPRYSLSPEARYPVALEECDAVLRWLAEGGEGWGVDGSRIGVAGDSSGANLAAALTLTTRLRSGPHLLTQLLFYPVTDAGFDTPSYLQFSEGYHLRRDVMRWFWDQYLPDLRRRREVTACPLRASDEELAGLPAALVITAEADVLRDEGETYAARLRAAGVPVTAVRYEGIIHDFMMLNAVRGTQAAQAAISQACAYLRDRLAVGPPR
jgi:acetyl esterase/lipase